MERFMGHGPVVDYFVEWCDNHFLNLNIIKTKDMAIDFQKTSYPAAPKIINGSLVESVNC